VENHLASLRGPSRAILRLVRSLDARTDAGTSETFLTASASWVRPTIAASPAATASRPTPTPVSTSASTPLGAAGPSEAAVEAARVAGVPAAADARRAAGRGRRVHLGAALAGLLLLVAAGVGAHAVAAHRARRATQPAETRRGAASTTSRQGGRPAGSLVLGSQPPDPGAE
jgi:hypothetical protein